MEEGRCKIRGDNPKDDLDGRVHISIGQEKNSIGVATVKTKFFALGHFFCFLRRVSFAVGIFYIEQLYIKIVADNCRAFLFNYFMPLRSHVLQR